MAVAENGHAVQSKERINGHVKGHVTTSPRTRARPRKSWSSWILNNIARLSIWYALITVIFRCPTSPTQLTDASPRICAPYFTTKQYVSPYLQPYYDTYAGPYVDIVRPYVDRINKQIVTPASAVVIQNYHKYAVPQLEKVQEYGVTQWNQHIRPQLAVAQDRATGLYSAKFEPHVAQASSIIEPYYQTAKDNALHIREQHVVPAIVYSKPHIESAYVVTSNFISGTAIPTVHYAWSNLSIFVEGTLWPFIKTVYVDNVRPQVVMISERIAKYQEGRKLQSAINEVDEIISSSVSSSATVEISSSPVIADGAAETLSSFMSSIVEDASSTIEEVSTSIRPAATRKTEYATEESITEDLVKWQKKFAVAADKGADDLRERVRDIVDGLVRSDIDSEGKGLADALEKTTEVEKENVKSKIRAVVGSLSDNASDSDEAEAENVITQAVRESGGKVRDRAMKVRNWAQRFEQDLIQRTTLAADTTLQVLDSVRDLGLQEIGMRWAWMEGVTYKHWKKYHDLKQRFEDWRNEVRSIATDHPSAQAAKELAETILEESMAITEEAAKELFRLKDVAKWKIRARDASDDFESRIIPAAAVSAASKIAEQVQDFTSGVVGSTQGTVEAFTSQVGAAASSLASSASSIAVEAPSNAEHAISAVSSAAKDKIVDAQDSVVKFAIEDSEAVTDVTSVVVNGVQGNIKSVASHASDSLSSVSSSVAGTHAGDAEFVVQDAGSSLASVASGGKDGVKSISSEASSSLSSVADVVDSASTIVQPPPTDTIGNVASAASSVIEDRYESASIAGSSVRSKASSKVFAGAMAQEVGGQAPVLDNPFGDEFEGLLQMLKDMTDGIDDAVDDLKDIANGMLGSTSQGIVESATSVVQEQVASALSAASNATPIVDSLIARASSVYNDAISQASEYKSAAEEVVSKQMGTSSKPIHSRMIESIASAYSGSVSQASARLNVAMIEASGQVSSLSSAAFAAYPTQGRIESVSSVAASRLQDALDAASAQYVSAKVAVGATPAPLTAQAQQNYYAAVGYAHEQYSSFVAAGSSAIYGAPTPVYQKLIDQAASQYTQASQIASSSLQAYLSSVSSIASQATKTKSPAQSVLDGASKSYSSALSVASASLSAASEQASAAVFGTPPPAYQEAVNLLTSQYAAATSLASQNLNSLLKSASSAVGKKQKSPAQSVLQSISAQYDAAMLAASSSLSLASASASSAIYGPAPGSFKSLSGAASENWEQLVSNASKRIYGQPTPVWISLASQAGEYSAQATDAAAEKFVIIQSFVSELIIGKEPAFTDSVMSRLSSAYHTDIAASASSLAGEAYASGSSIASSISSVASEFFTPPPEIDSILSKISSQLNEAVDAASSQAYGSGKGPVEKATSAASEAYASASSIASEAVYGTPVGYGEVVSKSVADAAQQASEALSLAIWGTPTGHAQSASSVISGQYEQISSAMSKSLSEASEKAASVADIAKSKVSEAIYGPEQNAFDSAQSQISQAVESAMSRIAEFGSQASSGAESAASAVSEQVHSVTEKVKDEL